MERSAIESLVRSYLDQSQAGLEIENPKFDFKSTWYHLKKSKDINEFIKDTSAIANTFGLDGFLVVGYNDRTKEFIDSRFSDSGLPDGSQIVDMVNKRVDRLFDLKVYDFEINSHK